MCMIWLILCSSTWQFVFDLKTSRPNHQIHGFLKHEWHSETSAKWRHHHRRPISAALLLHKWMRLNTMCYRIKGKPHCWHQHPMRSIPLCCSSFSFVCILMTTQGLWAIELPRAKVAWENHVATTAWFWWWIIFIQAQTQQISQIIIFMITLLRLRILVENHCTS